MFPYCSYHPILIQIASCVKVLCMYLAVFTAHCVHRQQYTGINLIYNNVIISDVFKM